MSPPKSALYNVHVHHHNYIHAITCENPLTQHLFDRYYYSIPGFRGGTLPFHDLCTRSIQSGANLLEIGSGPSNDTSDALARIGPLTGLDINPEVLGNRACSNTLLFDGQRFPFPNESFDACISNWVLEHVADPNSHFREVARVLRPGGVYCFRTPNLFHYVMLGSRLLPHSVHLRLANRLRGLSAGAHDPWPTFYRANRRGKLKQLIEDAGLIDAKIKMIEPEPSYGRAHSTLFYPMMAYERLVNSSAMLESFRVTILGKTTKPV